MAFQPTDISGCSLWLKADANVYTDAGTTLATNGQTVQQWNDQTSGANNASQATAGTRPTYLTSRINGKPSLYFNGSNFMDCANTTNFDLATPSIFVVARSLNNGGGSMTTKNTTSTTGNGRRKLQVAFNASGGFNYGSGGDGAQVSYSGSENRVFNIYSVIARGDSDHDLQINYTKQNFATALFDDTFSPAGVPVELGAGFDNGAEASVSEIAEVVMYNSALSAFDQARVLNYLQDKYYLPLTIQVFVASTTWTCPKGVYTIKAECWGGGGAGGARTSNGGGGGGGGGEYANEPSLVVTPGKTYTVTVGALGSNNGVTAVQPGNSTFPGDSVTVTGHGGTTVAINATTSGAGGTGSTNTNHHDGGAGAAAPSGTSGGGGGASGNSVATGNAGSTNTAGASAADGGIGGAGTATGNTNGSAPGTGPSGGGGGADRSSSGTRTGGSGFAGQVTLTYKVAPAAFSVSDIQNTMTMNMNQSVTRASYW